MFSEKEGKNLADYDVFIIDTVGILTKIYSYATIAYVGGGFGNPGVHNILEPATFGLPIVIGPNYSHFAEATELVQLGGCISIANATEWIYVDLGSNYNINRVVLKWEAAYATQYKVQLSTDNVFTENETINTQTASDGGTDDLAVSGTGRYLRILCTAKALAPYGYSLYEIEAYGSASAAKKANVTAEEVQAEETVFAVYPNPASSYLNIQPDTEKLKTLSMM